MTSERQIESGQDRESHAEAMGKRIAKARRQAGFRTAQEFADALDISVWTVRSWESGKSQPRYDMLNTISRLTEHSKAWFLGEETMQDRLDITIGELLARKVRAEAAAEEGEIGGVYGIAAVDHAAEEELIALSKSAREWGMLIRFTQAVPPATAEQIGALHLALAALAGSEPAQ
ncbi:MAG: helix-turn-helix transcriptional regulator [Armatimonadota bacterium]